MQTDLFPLASRPARAKPRKLMHVIDAGIGPASESLARFECGRCGHESDWMVCSWSEARRGIPCPKCNGH